MSPSCTTAWRGVSTAAGCSCPTVIAARSATSPMPGARSATRRCSRPARTRTASRTGQRWRLLVRAARRRRPAALPSGRSGGPHDIAAGQPAHDVLLRRSRTDRPLRDHRDRQAHDRAARPGTAGGINPTSATGRERDTSPSHHPLMLFVLTGGLSGARPERSRHSVGTYSILRSADRPVDRVCRCAHHCAGHDPSNGDCDGANVADRRARGGRSDGARSSGGLARCRRGQMTVALGRTPN